MAYMECLGHGRLVGTSIYVVFPKLWSEHPAAASSPIMWPPAAGGWLPPGMTWHDDTQFA